jgi:chemotaxis protein CheD
MQRQTIIQGEYYVANEPDVLIGTLLGSCIAICLHDSLARVGGMNHFLLGEPSGPERVRKTDMSRYGVHAMELLVNEMMKKGAARSRLKAHVYGGANIVAGLGQIGSSNAAFAKKFIATEGIALGHSDLGGNKARRVEFLPYLGKVRSWAVADPVPVPVAKPNLPDVSGDLELF